MRRRIFRLPDEMDEALQSEATIVPGRTVSDYLREIIDAALKRARKARETRK